MALTLHWLPEARDDLARLHAFLAPHSSDAAARAIETLIAAAGSLLAFPEKGRPWQPDMAFRELSVRFGARGYVIRYRLFEEKIVIVRVWHALQDR